MEKRNRRNTEVKEQGDWERQTDRQRRKQKDTGNHRLIHKQIDRRLRQHIETQAGTQKESARHAYKDLNYAYSSDAMTLSKDFGSYSESL